MKMTRAFVGACVSMLAISLALPVFAQDVPQRVGTLTSEITTIQSQTGITTEVQAGYLVVPERRSHNTGRVITIPYRVLKSKSATPGPAIFLLAGGPGSSGINKLRQQSVFESASFYQEFADVIAFDQRGTGASTPNLLYRADDSFDDGEIFSVETNMAAWRKQAADCKAHWESQGIDLTAYNTDENAADVNDLRKALGYEKIILVGGSYGTHLGFQVMRKYPDTVDRAMFSGIEGPDHTYDVPSEKLATLQRIAKAIEESGVYSSRLPDGGLLGALQTVLDRLREEPTIVTLTDGDKTYEARIDATFVEVIADRRAGDRDNPEYWPELILDMYDGDFSMPAQGLYAMRSMIDPINPMKYMMDCASGISDARRRRMAEGPARELLGDTALDLTILCDIWEAPDLGDAFRQNVVSDTPVLLLHGTWDTSTPIENARDVLRSLTNGHLIEVVGGSHGALYDLYDHWPPMRRLVADFFMGKAIDMPEQVAIPAFVFPGQEAISPDPQIRLWAAARSGDTEALNKAIADGADVNALDISRSRSGRRALNWAALSDHVEAITILLNSGAQINATNRTGFTPIHHAAESGSMNAARALLKAGADAMIPNKRGDLPAKTAAQLGHPDLAQLLGNAGEGPGN